MRRDRERDGAVAGVVAAIILTGAFAGFLAAVNLTWVPTWVANSEAAHSAEVREDMADWATAAEDHVARALMNRTFARPLEVGQEGIAVFGAGASSGRVSFGAGPALTVFHDGVQVATATGALTATTGSTRYPAQAFRFALGSLETDQGGDRHVELRSILAAQRAPGGKLQISVQALTLTGGTQDAGGRGDTTVLGTLQSASSTVRGPGTVRLLVDGEGAGAWRAAAERTLGASGLLGETLPDCAASSRLWCLDADTNDADTFDLTLLNVADGWTLTTGTVRVEVRT